MARKSRKTDFVNAGTTAADAASVKAEHEAEAKRPVYRAGLYARLSFESGANRERNTIETQMELLNVGRRIEGDINGKLFFQPFSH